MKFQDEVKKLQNRYDIVVKGKDLEAAALLTQDYRRLYFEIAEETLSWHRDWIFRYRSQFDSYKWMDRELARSTIDQAINSIEDDSSLGNHSKQHTRIIRFRVDEDREERGGLSHGSGLPIKDF